LVQGLRKTFLSGKTLPLSFREKQLFQLHKFVKENETQIIEACKDDLHKPKQETLVMEVGMVVGEIALCLEKLAEWMKPEYVSVDMINAMDKCQIRRDPLGVVLIIGAWNYPIQLTLVPLVGAIAAGCCAVLKPYEVSPATAKLLERLTDYLDPSCYKVVNGGVKETTGLLEEKWDHIFYTGSGNVGKIIMAAAAKHLTSVTLELGGKSPAIIDKGSDLGIVARRLAWGRFVNCGQTCIAPDYVLCCDGSEVPKLVSEIKRALNEFYTEDPKTCADYGRIVNKNHVHRLQKMMEGSGRAAIGGDVDADNKYFAPTVLTDVKPTDPVMQNEIFGPILPILSVSSIDEAIDFVNARDKPLALYVFSNNAKNADKVLEKTSSGSALVNDCLMQAAVASLPFGGVGPSGCGAYHGKLSFDVFSHRKAVMKKDQNLEAINDARYPKYTDQKLKLLAWLLFPTVSEGGSSLFSTKKIIILIIILAVFFKMTN